MRIDCTQAQTLFAAEASSIERQRVFWMLFNGLVNFA
jgi:hypothetical protein